MKLGIVGHAAEKFTPATEATARAAIRDAIRTLGAKTVVSGHSPMGGVDIWAEEIGLEEGCNLLIHAPKTFGWSGKDGYKSRNLAIARDSDLVLVVVVRELPQGFTGMKFDRCYHCHNRVPPHVKSGGCWTAWQAKRHLWRIV
jgi:hypothetical protein